MGVRNDQLLINISAPAVDNKANFALVAYLAKLLRIKKTEVLLVNGEKSRSKLLELSGISPDDARERLELTGSSEDKA